MKKTLAIAVACLLVGVAVAPVRYYVATEPESCDTNISQGRAPLLAVEAGSGPKHLPPVRYTRHRSKFVCID